MDSLGERIIKDTAVISEKRKLAGEMERQARNLYAEAKEMERLLDLAKQAR